MGGLLKIFERFLILKMLRVKRINNINVEELIYSGGIILGNICLFILYMMYVEDVVFKF